MLALDDISERKKMENELKLSREKAIESDRLKTAFLANISHEIRTPLNGIIGFTDLLTKEQQITKEQKLKYTTVIKNSTDSLIHIIDDIIDISRIESGTLEIDKAFFYIDTLINEVFTI